MENGVVGTVGHLVQRHVEMVLRREQEFATILSQITEVWNVLAIQQSSKRVSWMNVEVINQNIYNCALNLINIWNNLLSYYELFVILVCGNLTVTDHVILTCENISNDINCTISCEKGYGFDHTIKPFYLCGESTYHVWDFKTSDNPDGKLPQCTGTNSIQMINKLVIILSDKLVFILFFVLFTYFCRRER